MVASTPSLCNAKLFDSGGKNKPACGEQRTFGGDALEDMYSDMKSQLLLVPIPPADEPANKN
jgi:hypothetical protein